MYWLGQQRPWWECVLMQDLNVFTSLYAQRFLFLPCISPQNVTNYIGWAMWKPVFGRMRTAKAQISLRIGAGWSGPLLSANRVIGYYRIFQWRANARIRLRKCAEWCESACFTLAQRHFFAWCGPYRCVNEVKKLQVRQVFDKICHRILDKL